MAIDYDQLRAELIAAFHLEGLPKDKQNELLDKMTVAVMKRIFLETMEKLGEAGAEEYEKLMETDPEPKQVEDFLMAKIPNYQAMVEQIIADFKVEMGQGLEGVAVEK